MFGKNISAETVNNFLKAIPAKFRYWDIYLNHGNFFLLPGFKLYERMNYILPLHDDYEKIFSAFRENIKRNVKKAAQLNCFTQTNILINDVINLSKQQSKSFASIPNQDFEHFKNLYNQLYNKQKAITYGVYTSTKELVASCAFFFSHKRVYYILVGNHPNGRTIGASHALINSFIKDFAGKDLLLDFEGSDIRNLGFFYSSFGAIEEKYPGLKMNKLPKLIRAFKH